MVVRRRVSMERGGALLWRLRLGGGWIQRRLLRQLLPGSERIQRRRAGSGTTHRATAVGGTVACDNALDGLSGPVMGSSGLSRVFGFFI